VIVRPITLRAACAFVAEHHRHNKPPRGHLWSTSAWDGDRLIGVAIVGRPVARRLDNGQTAEVLRVCVLDDAPKGACSFLYGAAKRQAQAKGYARVITYTLESESGASLRGAGWSPNEATRGSQWSVPSRPRASQPVCAQAKIRWEART
jgi:hypothetical protein